MKISRRALTGIVLAGAASAQTPAQPQPGAGVLDEAKQQVARNTEALRKHELSMAAEPAFQFKA